MPTQKHKKFQYKNFAISCTNPGYEYHTMFVITPFYKGDYALMMVGFHSLKKFLAQHFPEKAAQIRKARNAIGGYGSKENKVLELLQKEGFPLEECVVQYFDADPDKVLRLIKRQSEGRKKDELGHEGARKRVQRAINVWARDQSDFVMDDFVDELEQSIVGYLMDKYPNEMDDFEPEDYKEMNKLFSRHIPEISVQLIDHIDKFEED